MRPSVLVLSLALLVAIPACGKDDGGSAADCTTLKQGSSQTTRMTLTAKNLAFDKTCVRIKPGALTITFHNEDQGVSHNLHITGHGVNVTTDLEAGVTTQTLDAVLTDPGKYTYACDPHGGMEGTIEVVEAS